MLRAILHAGHVSEAGAAGTIISSDFGTRSGTSAVPLTITAHALVVNGTCAVAGSRTVGACMFVGSRAWPARTSLSKACAWEWSCHSLAPWLWQSPGRSEVKKWIRSDSADERGTRAAGWVMEDFGTVNVVLQRWSIEMTKFRFGPLTSILWASVSGVIIHNLNTQVHLKDL